MPDKLPRPPTIIGRAAIFLDAETCPLVSLCSGMFRNLESETICCN